MHWRAISLTDSWDGRVDPVQVVDSAVGLIGGKERRFDCVEFHGRTTAGKVPHEGECVKTQFQGWTTHNGCR